MASPQLHKLAPYVGADRDQITAGKALHAHANSEVLVTNASPFESRE